MPFRALNYKFISYFLNTKSFTSYGLEKLSCLKTNHPKLIVNCTPSHAITTNYQINVYERSELENTYIKPICIDYNFTEVLGGYCLKIKIYFKNFAKAFPEK